MNSGSTAHCLAGTVLLTRSQPTRTCEQPGVAGDAVADFHRKLAGVWLLVCSWQSWCACSTQTHIPLSPQQPNCVRSHTCCVTRLHTPIHTTTALQEDQESQGSSVNAWLKQPHTAATTTAAAGGSSSSTSWRSSSSSTGGGDEAHLATSTSAADGAEAAAREQEGRVTSSSPLVHPDYGYAVLGGIDPASSQQVAGAQQPKLHPTRNFNVGESYDPLVSQRAGCVGCM